MPYNQYAINTPIMERQLANSDTTATTRCSEPVEAWQVKNIPFDIAIEDIKFETNQTTRPVISSATGQTYIPVAEKLGFNLLF